MEGHSYISCIKINGVPILPPLMTKDIKKEMSNYKEIAISIEKRLANLRNAREQNNDIDTDTFKKDFNGRRTNMCNSKENLFLSDCKKYQNKNETNINGFSTDISESSSESIKQNLQWNEQVNNNHVSEYRINLDSGTCLKSELLSSKTNADQCTQNISSTKSNTIETPDVCKPQVPKTLNIIPLTLNDPVPKDEIYQTTHSNDIGDTPKLVRQGSYVLDTPSPILLAHMQMEQCNSTIKPCMEYVATPYLNTVNRREWNITQAKIEWENEFTGKQFASTESLELCSNKETNVDTRTSQQMHKSVSSLTIPTSIYATYPATKSVDCIQTMLADESIEKSNVQINNDRNCAIDKNSEKKQNLQCWKRYNSSSNFQVSYNHDNFLDNATNSDISFSNNLKNEHNKVPISDSCAEEISRNADTKDLTSKLKFNITSDKLLTVYKKVQEMHKKQMAELVFRQQKEQTLLQEEFEKQQLLLLTEIRKSFPEISVSLLPENILSTPLNQVTPNHDKLSKDTDHNMEHVKNVKSNFQDESKIIHLQDNNKKVVSYSVDNSCSKNSLPVTESCVMGKEEVNVQPDKDKSYEKKLVKDGGGCKRLNVSRQLFPLDSKTVHVPILDRTIYGSKHVEAVNVINGYTRGYLVRRMMRTERVIALKNIYKEALHCMLKLHVDAPLNRSEFNFLYRLQLQCEAASMNVVELFAQSPKKRMQVIAQDREIKQSRIERPTSARSYSFATQRTLARKRLKEMKEHQPSSFARSCLSRSRCQTWTSDDKEKIFSPNILYQNIKRSTSAGTVRKPWR
nr:uncharacterized protein LOC116424954 isoform X2 [Nomia melanderi]